MLVEDSWIRRQNIKLEPGNLGVKPSRTSSLSYRQVSVKPGKHISLMFKLKYSVNIALISEIRKMTAFHNLDCCTHQDSCWSLWHWTRFHMHLWILAHQSSPTNYCKFKLKPNFTLNFCPRSQLKVIMMQWSCLLFPKSIFQLMNM